MPTQEDLLSTISWNEKTVASGKADNVPQSLTGLLSPDEKVRNRSYWQLDNEVVLQSDLYEAAYFVIPFLVRFLCEKVSHGRDRIYDLLHEIAEGDAPANVMCRTIEGDQIPLKEACARELYKGLSVFLRDASEGNALICDKAKDLMEVIGGNKLEAGVPAKPTTRGFADAVSAAERS